MATTIVPDPRPLDPKVTTQQVLDAVHEALVIAQGDLDKADEEANVYYYEGLVAGYKEVELMLTNMPALCRVIADYQMFGEQEADLWMNLLLENAQASGEIVDYNVFITAPETAGVQYIAFTVDVNLQKGSFEEVKESAREFVNKLIGDTDVQVHWVHLL